MTQRLHSDTCQLILYSLGSRVEKLRNLGGYGYSYGFLKDNLIDLIKGYAEVKEIVRPESQLEFAILKAKSKKKSPLVFGFVPFQDFYPTKAAPSVIYMCWEFPDVPDASLNNNPRFDWLRLSQYVALIIVPTRFVKDVLQAAGVRTPIQVVPVPMPAHLLRLPLWEAGQSVTIDTPAVVLDLKAPEESAAVASVTPRRGAMRRGLKWLRMRCVDAVWYAMPGQLTEILNQKRIVRRAARLQAKAEKREAIAPVEDHSDGLTLRGVVYTMIFNPLDDRKNWPDLVTAFVHGLREMSDATLVLKMTVAEQSSQSQVNAAKTVYSRLSSIPHLCRVVVITKPLTNTQMASLLRATTYYANITRAEGACLPLQEALAAGRPALSPTHTAMGDYFDEDVGFVVEMNPEPTHWPGDESRKMTTSWARLNWRSLHDQFVDSYKTAKDRRAYRARAEAARQRLIEYANAESVRMKLYEALDSVDLKKSFDVSQCAGVSGT